MEIFCKEKLYSQYEKKRRLKSLDLESPHCRQKWPSLAYTFRFEFLDLYVTILYRKANTYVFAINCTACDYDLYINSSSTMF